MNNIKKIQNLQRCESLKKLDMTLNFVPKSGLLSLHSLQVPNHTTCETHSVNTPIITCRSYIRIPHYYVICAIDYYHDNMEWMKLCIFNCAYIDILQSLSMFQLDKKISGSGLRTLLYSPSGSNVCVALRVNDESLEQQYGQI